MLYVFQWFFEHISAKIFIPFFTAFVRPNFEYCVQAWSRYVRREAKKLEGVQRLSPPQVIFRSDLNASFRIIQGVDNIDPKKIVLRSSRLPKTGEVMSRANLTKNTDNLSNIFRKD